MLKIAFLSSLYLNALNCVKTINEILSKKTLLGNLPKTYDHIFKWHVFLRKIDTRKTNYAAVRAAFFVLLD